MKGHHLGSQAGPVATNLAIQWQPKTPLSWPSPGPTRRRSSAVRRPHPLTSPAASAMRNIVKKNSGVAWWSQCHKLHHQSSLCKEGGGSILLLIRGCFQ
ncbi:hypothetical protein PAHAL_5G213300 [Panicum hallii]|uniref:Uncharacterized protein n=1 Tax=Panicum hallii TaxID=206008 RepID=A0A2T8IKQ6_9POAL|nr:hypothetical protein PAHAL_5G213300 [Panicum hallii]